VLAELSEPLRAEVSLARCKTFLLNPKFNEIIGNSSTPQIMKRLVEKLVHTVFSPGDFVLQEGDQGTEMYFMAQGAAAVLVHKEQVAVLYAGDCFGEIALLLPKVVRTASVVARSFCEAYKLSVADFQFCLADFPDIQTRMRTIAHERLAELKAKEEENKSPQSKWALALQRQSSSLTGSSTRTSFADVVMRATGESRRSQTRRRSGEYSGEIDVPVNSAFELIARRPSLATHPPIQALATDGLPEPSKISPTVDTRAEPSHGRFVGARDLKCKSPELTPSDVPLGHTSASTNRANCELSA